MGMCKVPALCLTRQRNAHFGVCIGYARIFRYQHVGIAIAKCLHWGLCPKPDPNANGFVIMEFIKFLYDDYGNVCLFGPIQQIVRLLHNAVNTHNIFTFGSKSLFHDASSASQTPEVAGYNSMCKDNNLNTSSDCGQD